jgi:hypothetical protein
MTIVPMLARGTVLEPMFREQGPDIRYKSNTRVIHAARDRIRTERGLPFNVESLTIYAGMPCPGYVIKSAIRKRRWLADVRKFNGLDLACYCYRAARAAPVVDDNGGELLQVRACTSAE